MQNGYPVQSVIDSKSKLMIGKQNNAKPFASLADVTKLRNQSVFCSSTKNIPAFIAKA